MNKLFLAMTLLVTATAALPANAMPRSDAANAKMFASSPGGTLQVGDQCWKPTDSGRGFGYWTSCDNVYAFTLGRRGIQEMRGTIENGGGTEGGGGGDGGGGGGGAR